MPKLLNILARALGERVEHLVPTLHQYPKVRSRSLRDNGRRYKLHFNVSFQWKLSEEPPTFESLKFVAIGLNVNSDKFTSFIDKGPSHDDTQVRSARALLRNCCLFLTRTRSFRLSRFASSGASDPSYVASRTEVCGRQLCGATRTRHERSPVRVVCSRRSLDSHSAGA